MSRLVVREELDPEYLESLTPEEREAAIFYHNQIHGVESRPVLTVSEALESRGIIIPKMTQQQKEKNAARLNRLRKQGLIPSFMVPRSTVPSPAIDFTPLKEDESEGECGGSGLARSQGARIRGAI